MRKGQSMAKSKEQIGSAFHLAQHWPSARFNDVALSTSMDPSPGMQTQHQHLASKKPIVRQNILSPVLFHGVQQAGHKKAGLQLVKNHRSTRYPLLMQA